MEQEATRLSQLTASKDLKDRFSEYDKDVDMYFSDLFNSMKGNSAKTSTSKRFNTMINNTIFTDYDKEKAELTQMKDFMK
jgi:hypothetical protein